MPRKSRKAKPNNLRVGLLFVSLVVFLIVLSLFGKMILVLKQSKYDGNYPFYLEISSNKERQVLSFFPKQSKISILNVQDLNALLPVPIEAKITKTPKIATAKNLSSFLTLLLENKDVKTDITSIDIVRLYWLSKTIGSDNIAVSTLPVSSDAAIEDKIIYTLFSDPLIISDDLRIEVVNATGVYGVGNRVARLLSNIGVNVVFVSTADKVEKQSVIFYTDDLGYTAKDLSRILGFEVIQNKQKSISDIKIQIGQDSLDSIGK